MISALQHEQEMVFMDIDDHFSARIYFSNVESNLSDTLKYVASNRINASIRNISIIEVDGISSHTMSLIFLEVAKLISLNQQIPIASVWFALMSMYVG